MGWDWIFDSRFGIAVVRLQSEVFILLRIQPFWWEREGTGGWRRRGRR